MRTRELKNKGAYGYAVNRMNDETYQLRRRVMDVLYEAKHRGFKLPRVEVRVVDATDEVELHCAGYAYLSSKVIHIPRATFKSYKEKDFVGVVLHEVVHAVTGFRHDDNCPLMSPYIDKSMSLEDAWKHFAKYF